MIYNIYKYNNNNRTNGVACCSWKQAHSNCRIMKRCAVRCNCGKSCIWQQNWTHNHTNRTPCHPPSTLICADKMTARMRGCHWFGVDLQLLHDCCSLLMLQHRNYYYYLLLLLFSLLLLLLLWLLSVPSPAAFVGYIRS